jgi:Tol biopolymer transport system component
MVWVKMNSFISIEQSKVTFKQQCYEEKRHNFANSVFLLFFVFVLSFLFMGILLTVQENNIKSDIFRSAISIPKTLPTSTPQPSLEGKIAFVSDKNRYLEICVTDFGMSAIQCLGDNNGNYYSPSWSLDGQTISFVSDRDGNPEIYIMDVDGSDVRRLTDNEAGDYDPNWSPDGQYIAFMSDRDDNPEIYIMDVDGSDVRRLTYNVASDNRSEDYAPSWSPDGEYIAFYSFRTGSWNIYIIEMSSSETTCLTCESIGGKTPTWSPNGQTIAFVSGNDICTIDTNGGNRRCLGITYAFGDTWGLDWSS